VVLGQKSSCPAAVAAFGRLDYLFELSVEVDLDAEEKRYFEQNALEFANAFCEIC
jgi:hypothetical protein